MAVDITPPLNPVLAGCHPTLITKVGVLLAAMRALGFPMHPTDGVRTVAQQVARYAQGRTAPGPIVTNANGTTKPSNHQVQADGFGHAVDCCFLVNGVPSWDIHLPWKAYGACAEALGLAWGGNWTTTALHDLPHVELPLQAPVQVAV